MQLGYPKKHYHNSAFLGMFRQHSTYNDNNLHVHKAENSMDRANYPPRKIQIQIYYLELFSNPAETSKLFQEI